MKYIIVIHNFFQNAPWPLLSDCCDLSAPVCWALSHHDCEDLAEFSWLCGTWFCFCGKETRMQESANKHWGMLGPLPHLGGDQNLPYSTIFIEKYENMWCIQYVCVFISVFYITEASSGAAVYPEAPPCLYLQPNTAPDSTFTRLSPWHLPNLSLPSGLTVWLHLLLLKPHRVWNLLKGHTQLIHTHSLLCLLCKKLLILLCIRCHKNMI